MLIEQWAHASRVLEFSRIIGEETMQMIILCIVVYPREYALVIGTSQDLFLQSLEGSHTLTI